MTSEPERRKRPPHQRIFSVAFLRALGVTAVAIAGILLAVFLAWPARLEGEMARFVFCLIVALDLAIFFFVFYPANFELTEVPIIKLPVRLVGPVVLFVVLLLLLLQLAPQVAAGGRLLRPVSHGKPVMVRFSSETMITPREGEPSFIWYLVPERDRPGVLAGVYVEFAPGRLAYRAAWQHGLRSPVDVTLSREKPTFEIGNHP